VRGFTLGLLAALAVYVALHQRLDRYRFMRRF